MASHRFKLSFTTVYIYGDEMRKIFHWLLFLTLAGIALSGCGYDSSSPEDTSQNSTLSISPPEINSPAIATVDVPFFLTASIPETDNQEQLEYHWELTDKPTNSQATLTKDRGNLCSLKADQPGHYQIQLVASDGNASSEPTVQDINAVAAFLKTYGGNRAEHAYSVVQTMDGGYAICGSTNSFGAGNNDVFLVRTDPLGNELWQKTFGSNEDETALTIIETLDNGFLLAGWNGIAVNNSTDILLIRTDSSGNKLWEQHYGGNGRETAYAVTATADGHFILAGDTTSLGNGGDDCYLLKVDDNGTFEWESTQGTSGTELAYDLIQAGQGTLLTTGYTQSSQSKSWDVLLTEFSEDGDVLWEKSFGDNGYDWGAGVTLTPTGDILLLATIDKWKDQIAGSDLDLGLFKLSAQGEILWQYTYGGAARDWGKAISLSPSGETLLAGYTESYGAGNWDVYLVAVDDSGTELWSRTFGGLQSDYASAMVATSDGGCALVGTTYSFGSGSGDFLFVKTDAAGNLPPTTTDLPLLVAESNESVQFDCASGFQETTDDLLTFAAYGLPDGLTLDPQTGILSGTTPDLMSEQIYDLTIIATGTSGLSAAQTTTLTVHSND